MVSIFLKKLIPSPVSSSGISHVKAFEGPTDVAQRSHTSATLKREF